MPRKVPLPSLLGNLVRFWCGMRCWVTPGFAPNILRPEKGICAVRILVRDLGGWHAQVLRICFAPYYEPDLGTDLGHDLAWLGRWGGPSLCSALTGTIWQLVSFVAGLLP